MSDERKNINDAYKARVYSRSEFARLVNRSTETLRRWAKKGILVPSRYPSGRPFYTESHLSSVLGSAGSKQGECAHGTSTRNR